MAHHAGILARIKERAGAETFDATFATGLVDVPYDEHFWETVGIGRIVPQTDANITLMFKRIASLLIMRDQPSTTIQMAAILSCYVKLPNNQFIHEVSEVDNYGYNNDYPITIEEPAEEVNIPITAATYQNFNELEEFKQNFLRAVYSMGNQTGSIVGPIFALVLLRLEKHQSYTVAQKIIKLPAILGNAYPGVRFDLSLGTDENWTNHFGDVFRNVSPDTLIKSTSFLNLVDYYTGPASSAIRGLLDFCMLQSIRYSGMTLITIVAQLVSEFGCPIKDVIDRSLFAASVHAWDSYLNITETYMRKGQPNPDLKWMYSKEFNPGAFSSISYAKTWWLCQYLACMLDEIINPDMIVDELRGPVLAGLINVRGQNSKKISEAVMERAKEKARELNELYLFVPLDEASKGRPTVPVDVDNVLG